MSNIFKNMTDKELAYELKLSARQRGSMLRTEAIMEEILRRQTKPKTKMSKEKDNNPCVCKKLII